MPEIHRTLARARDRARYSQDDVGAALGVSRAMVSYWETGTRAPNDRQLAALARLYGVALADIIENRELEPAGGDLTSMLLRAEPEVDPESARGINEFFQFLDRFGELARIVDQPLRTLTRSPFIHRPRFATKEDARRKAEDVRAHLGLGFGPIQDLDDVCEMLGIIIFRASLGGDLSSAPSGAFVNHPEAGFAILVNLDMTPGRRRFTAAHEIAHALFHSEETRYVVSRGRNPHEAFADEFAGEFLMPQEGVRRFMEEAGMPPQITDPFHAIHIQRYFRASFPTTLVRLRQMKVLTVATYNEMKNTVRPVAFARSLGYSVDSEEIRQDSELWRIRKYPRAFLRRLRAAVNEGHMSPPSAASFAGMALPDLVFVLGDPSIPSVEPPDLTDEFREYEITGVI